MACGTPRRDGRIDCTVGPIARYTPHDSTERREASVRKVLFIFSVLSDGDVEWLAEAGERLHVDPGTEVIALGAKVEHIYFVLEGRLGIRTRTGATVSTLESGEIVGEMSLVDPAPTVVSVHALAESTLLRIADARVREKLASDLAFAAR